MANVITQSYMLLTEEEKHIGNNSHMPGNPIANGKSDLNKDVILNQIFRTSASPKKENNNINSHSSEDKLNHPELEDLNHSQTSNKHTENKNSESVNALDTSDGKNVEIPIIFKWDNIIAVTIVHLLGIYGVFYMALHWSTLTILYSFLIGGISGFGVTGGAHRYWTHRSYKAKTPLQIILLFCYTVAGQNTIYEWVRDHRVHHKYSETNADPHNSNRGFFFSHVGWLLSRKHPDVIEKGNKIDMTDITSDPLLEWHRRNFNWLRILICFVLPTYIPMYLWGETFKYAFFSNIVRYTISLNATWSVNSFAHIWGYKPYDGRLKPVENIGVAIASMGEGWHNYHHAFPWDYRASEMGYRYNYTAFLIDQFAKIGWAYDLKKPSENLVATMAKKYGEVPRRTDRMQSEDIKKTT